MPTILEVIEQLTKPMGRIENTVDTLQAGKLLDEVRGIATAFMPSYSVLQKAMARDFNLVIAHEALYYSHLNQVEMLARDPVYLRKKALLAQSGIGVFRLHDAMHRANPDKITESLVRDLGWERYVDKQGITVELNRTLALYPLAIPDMSLREVVEYVKGKLKIPYVRMVGDLSMRCSRVGLLPGYQGTGNLAIRYFEMADLDLIITGEAPEWETPEYIRDAVSQGLNKALLVIGHEVSEESGMRDLAGSLRAIYPAVPVEFITVNKPIQHL